jgi:hypothetical protein
VEGGALWRNGCDGKVLRCGAGKRHQQPCPVARRALQARRSTVPYRIIIILYYTGKTQNGTSLPTKRFLKVWCAPTVPCTAVLARGAHTWPMLMRMRNTPEAQHVLLMRGYISELNSSSPPQGRGI